MLKRNFFNVHWKFGGGQQWEPAGRKGDFGNFLNSFAKSPRVLRTVLNIECVQFVLKNCEMLHFVCGLYHKNSASYYCFTSDVTYKEYEMLVYTHPELLARFCRENLSKAKIRPDLFSKKSFSRPVIYCDQELLWLLNVIGDDCYFLGVYIQLSIRCNIFFHFKIT